MKKKPLNTRLYLMYIIALFPLICYGFYKNGISLYTKNLVGFIDMFKPLGLLLACLLGSLSGGFIHAKFKSNSKKMDKGFAALKGNFVEALLVAAVLPINTNFIVPLVVTFIFGLVLDRCKFNKIALTYIAIESINVYLGLNNFGNIYETSTILNYNGVDLFFGLGTGGIFATSVFLTIIGFIFLGFNKLYKKELAISALIPYIVLVIATCMLKNDYTAIFPQIFGFNIIFAFIFIAPNLYSSSYTLKGQVLSGILIGILTYVLFYFTHYTSAILAILIVSLFKGIFDRIFVIK